MTRETQSKLLGEFYAEKKNILKLKGEDYANEDVLSNFKTAGANIGISAEQQCLSLIATKVARLGNLLSGKTPNNESVSDSILDLSNYTDLLYCLVNDEYLMTNIDDFPTNLSPKEVLEKFYKQPLEFKVSKPQTKRWENVKPKAIINQINWTDKCSDTADKIEEELRKLENSKKFHDDFKNELSKLSELSAELNNEKTECDCTEIPTEYKPTPEPTTESYEPKVGDRFTNKIGIIWEITEVFVKQRLF
jgi:ATP-dependent Lon protease